MQFFKSVLLIASLSFSSLTLAQDKITTNAVSDAVSEVQVQVQAININKAGADELAQLNRIGLKKAQKIIEYRNTHGSFKSVDDLQNVKGIGSSTIEHNRSRMMVVN